MQLPFQRNNMQKTSINSLNEFHKQMQHFHLKSRTACVWISEKLRLILASHFGTLKGKKISKRTKIKQPMSEKKEEKKGDFRSESVRQSVKLQQSLVKPFSKCAKCASQRSNYRGSPIAAIIWIVTRAKKQVNIVNALKIISFAAILESEKTSERMTEVL